MSLYKQAPTVTVHDGRPVLDNTQQAAPESPTGIPAIPPKAVPWLTGLVAAALVAGRSFPLGHPVQVVADALTDVAVLFGLASPGWRRK